MKSGVLFFLLATAFSTITFAQGDSQLTLDLRPGLSESRVAGVTRSRVLPDNTAVRAPESSTAGKLERRIFDILNAERRSQGLADLEWNDEVAAVARLHSQNMAEEKFFSHRGSDGS